MTNEPMFDRLRGWFDRLTTPRKLWLLSAFIFLILVLGGANQRDRQNQVIKTTSEQVQSLETQMREELRSSAELHGRIQERLDQIEKEIAAMQKRDR